MASSSVRLLTSRMSRYAFWCISSQPQLLRKQPSNQCLAQLSVRLESSAPNPVEISVPLTPTPAPVRHRDASLTLTDEGLEQLRQLSIEMMGKVGKEINKHGDKMTLCISNQKAENLPTFVLLKYGISPTEAIRFLADHPSMLEVNANHLDALLKISLGWGFTSKQFFRLCTAFGKDLLNTGNAVRMFNDSINGFAAFGVHGDLAANIIKQCPSVAKKSSDQLREMRQYLHSVFTNKSIWHVLAKNHPAIFDKEPRVVQEKFWYLWRYMGASEKEIAKSHFYEQTVEFLNTRHEFLMRTGAWIKPHPKKPQLTKDNPKVMDIVDTTDESFAVLAGVTPGEYATFKKMYSKEIDNGDGKSIGRMMPYTGSDDEDLVLPPREKYVPDDMLEGEPEDNSEYELRDEEDELRKFVEEEEAKARASFDDDDDDSEETEEPDGRKLHR